MSLLFTANSVVVVLPALVDAVGEKATSLLKEAAVTPRKTKREQEKLRGINKEG